MGGGNGKSFLLLFFSLFFASLSDDKAQRIEKTKPAFSSITLSLFPALRPLVRRKRVFACPSAR